MRDFLRMVGVEELVDRNVLQPHRTMTYILRGESLYPLLRLMRDRDVEILTHGEKWLLNINEDYVNRIKWSPSPNSGRLSQLRHDGHLFWGTNPVMNPFYESTT